MAILNRDNFYHLGSRDFIEKRESTSTWFIRDFHNDPVDYYFFDFKDGDVFDYYPLHQFLTNEEIQSIKDRKVMLCIDNCHESYHSIIDPLYRSLVIKQGIPADQILLLTESADIATEIERIASLYNQPLMKAEWICTFEYNIQVNIKERYPNEQDIPNRLQLKDYSKKFLNFNRRWRSQRVLLVALMKAYGILDYGYVSLGKADDNMSWNEGLFTWIDSLLNHEPSKLKLKRFKSDILSLPEMYLDNTNLVENQPLLDDATHPFYDNSYFSVVTETNFFKSPTYGRDESARFFSEKIFKPVAECHPLIIVSVPNMLEKWTELGYKSYSPYIDESYDSESNESLRMFKIIKEIKRLSELSGDELTTFLNGVKEITTYNYNVLRNKTLFCRRLNY